MRISFLRGVKNLHQGAGYMSADCTFDWGCKYGSVHICPPILSGHWCVTQEVVMLGGAGRTPTVVWYSDHLKHRPIGLDGVAFALL